MLPAFERVGRLHSHKDKETGSDLADDAIIDLDLS